jgi:pyridoxal 5'-phosphate synthase glutaminase subunit Pdx2
VLALQGAFREHAQALREVGVQPVEVRRSSDLDGVRGLVIPGGESTTMSKLMTAYGLEQPIRDLHAGGAPVFGTCAGMILIARDAVDGLPDQRTLGLIDITVRRNAFGRQVARPTCAWRARPIRFPASSSGRRGSSRLALAWRCWPPMPATAWPPGRAACSSPHSIPS